MITLFYIQPKMQEEQQVTVEFASMEGIRLYTINMDRERNCYNCGEFGYIIKHCKSWGIVSQRRRIEYRDN